MLRIIVSVLLIALAGPAAAQVTGAIKPTVPKLKELVVVNSEIVRIGDLVDNAGPNSGVAVFRAPDLGSTGGVPLARVMEALAPYKIAYLDTGNIKEVVVTRPSRTITAKEIEARIARALAAQYGFGDAKNITIAFDRDLRAINVEPTATEDLQIARIDMDSRTGRFYAALEVPGSTLTRRLPLRFSGTAVETLDAVVLVHSISRGEIIRPTDVATERRPKAELTGEFVGTDGAVGQAAKRQLRAGTVLRPSDLMRPEVVQRNEPVTITYEVPGVLLTARGKALEAGAVGDVVGILNIQSNRTVQATITGPGRVSVVAPILTPSSAAAAASNPPASPRPTTE